MKFCDSNSIFDYMMKPLSYFARRISHGNKSKYLDATSLIPCSTDMINIESLSDQSLLLPGMISAESGKFLFALCYMQQIAGDVLEIGSWQGRSSCFLATAVKESGNGKFYAIDHFRGNVGKEEHYIVNNDDLSDLRLNYESNMRNLGLWDGITLLDMPNEEAVKYLDDVKIRFLFIDGDHSKSGVEKDIQLFFPKLVDGAIVVFDDFSNNFPGVVESVNKMLLVEKHNKAMYYCNSLVVKIIR